MNARHRFTGLLALALLGALDVGAATPDSGTLTDVSGPLTYSAGPFLVANATPIPLVDAGPECNNPPQPCDDYTLTITLPAGYAAAHPLAAAKVTMSWTDTGSGNSDYDLYVYQGVVPATDGSQQAYSQSASGSDPEVAVFMSLVDGSSTYTVKVVPYTPSGETVNVQIELLPGGDITLAPFGGPDPTVAGLPRFQNYYAPHGSSAEAGSGEFNIGFNPASGRIMTMNSGPIWRVTPAPVIDATNPESCDPLWEDKSSLVTNTGLDPILWTDQKTGRTFASNSTAGANAAYAYSDDDGDLWIPFGVSPPSGGADHETIGSGPFPASLSILATPINQGENVIYCSQDVAGPATCQRSLDLGSTWGPGVLAYTGSGPDGCGGLHGHVHIAPDGTVWLPVNQCTNHQGGVTSTDAGTTFTEFVVPPSTPQVQGADPSIAIDADSTAYYCYVNNEPVGDGQPPEGHVHVAVSKDGGAHWIRDFDVGAAHGIVNAAQVEAVGGSSGRAACGFIGTNYPGDYQALSFPGTWYAFIATTYDEGQTWTTVNATPNDPVQSRTGVWQQGGGAEDRNLLDFNEITLDATGRVLYGYSDGCVTAGCIDGLLPNDFVAHMRVAHQTGGKSLLAQFDPVEPQAPQRACLAGTRDPLASHLSWKAPDNGGADIDNYLVYRSTTSGAETFLGQTKGPTTSFDDTTADASVADYFYTVVAVNGSGSGTASNEIQLQVVESPPPQSVCSVPGMTLLTDPSGDATLSPTPAPAPAGADLLSVQLAQPLAIDGDIKLTFTLHTDPGQSPEPPGSAWYVAMRIADPAPAMTYHYRAVHMAWSGSTPTFESYTPGANSNGGVDGRFVESGSQLPAEAESSYEAPYDTVVIVVKASDLGLAPGDVISGFIAGSAQTTDAGGLGIGATEVYDGMPNSLGWEGTYTVGNSFDCDVIFRDSFE
jgi:hypothetical protein